MNTCIWFVYGGVERKLLLLFLRSYKPVLVLFHSSAIGTANGHKTKDTLHYTEQDHLCSATISGNWTDWIHKRIQWSLGLTQIKSYISVTRIIAGGGAWRGKVVRGGEALRAHCQACTIRYKNVHSDWSYGYTSNRVNVFERDKTLPDRYEVSLAVAKPRRLQVFTVLRELRAKVVLHWHSRNFVTCKITFCCQVTLCNLINIYQIFRINFCLHLQIIRF